MHHRRNVMLEMVRQNWEHLRHIEQLRMRLANFYAVVVAGVLAFITQAPNINQRPLLIVLAALSLFGVVTTLRFNAHIPFRLEKLRELARQMGVPADRIAYFGSEDWTRWIRFRNIFLWLLSLGSK
jgi:hypothetical protein